MNRVWLLHYTLSVLEGVLPSLYLEHFALLVWSIHTLLSDDLRENDVERSQKALDEFCSGMESLYGKMRFQITLLLCFFYIETLLN